MRTIKVIDETLRDGEQQPCINFSKEQKIDLARLIFETGVDYITLMPASSEYEAQTAKEIAKLGPVLLLTPCREECIRQSIELSRNILLYQASSDQLVTHRHHIKDVVEARKQNLRNILNSINLAKESGADVWFGLEDATRSDREYIKQILREIESLVSHIVIPDSAGVLSPQETADLIKFIKAETTHPIIIHTHNDLGYADENAVAAVESGADYISGTFTGIGERAGNMNLRKVLKALESKNYLLNIKMEALDSLEKKILEFSGRGPNTPGSEQSFWHESGYHAHALLTGDPMAYCAIDPKTLGFKHKILFGKKSGTSNFKYYLGDKYSETEYREFLEEIKRLSIKDRKTYTFEEVCSLLGIK